MCTTNLIDLPLAGRATGDAGAVRISRAVVSCDHPAALVCDHAVLLDLWDDTGPRRSRVSLELEPQAAKALAEAILSSVAAAHAELTATSVTGARRPAT